MSKTAIIVPNNMGARMMDRNPIPEARIALISLSSDKRPKAIRVESRTAIGTDKAMIQAKLRNKYSRIVSTSNPLPKKRSIARSRKLMNNRKVIINSEKIKGNTISRTKYLDRSRIVKITIYCEGKKSAFLRFILNYLLELVDALFGKLLYLFMFFTSKL
jgi:hypothetical protein